MNQRPTLDQLAILNGTDKSSKHHNYCVVYEKYLESLRDKDILLFECGTGGYHFPNRGFEGAKTWRQYFPHATIVSTDIHPKVNVPDGVFFEQGSQDDPEFWQKVVDKYGQPDVFIDDASHINGKTVKTFDLMFSRLKSGGLYIVEDCHTSYWRDIASDGTDFEGGVNRPGTIIERIKAFIDIIHCAHIQSEYLGDKHNIASLHIYEKLVFIEKK